MTANDGPRTDAAFLWETEALRSKRRGDGAAPTRSGAPPSAGRAEQPRPAEPRPPGEWVTLREAEAVSGVARSTIRNWAKRGRVRSHIGPAAGSPRMVDIDEVRSHAAERGHVAPQPRPPSPAAAPEGSMIVPIDAWERILLQLGNLHEAGRELAEARERAARAETEAAFLRERLAELRDRTGETPAGAAVAPPPPAATAPPPPASPADAVTLLDRARSVRDRIEAWRRKR